MGFAKWWLFHVRNGVVWRGEHGGFRAEFRRFDLRIRTVSGNFAATFVAGETPARLLAALNAGDETTLWGFCERVYMYSNMLMSDRALAEAMDAVLLSRCGAEAEPLPEDDFEESSAMEEMRGAQEYVDMSPGERRKYERAVDRRFRRRLRGNGTGFAGEDDAKQHE